MNLEAVLGGGDGLFERLVDIVRRLGAAEAGSIALKFAMVGPAVVMLGAGAIDLMAVHSAKDRLQSIADSAALAGAPSLSLAADGSTARARAAAFVEGQMSEWGDAPTYQATYELVDLDEQRGLRVLLQANRPSFFANMLPPGGWDFIGDATASTVSTVPLCVLVSGQGGSKLLNIKDAARMTAPACMVHSNRDIDVEGGTLAAAAVQAVTSARGFISPSAGTGAARITDPFLGLDLDLSKKDDCTDAAREKPFKVSSGHALRRCGTALRRYRRIRDRPDHP